MQVKLRDGLSRSKSSNKDTMKEACEIKVTCIRMMPHCFCKKLKCGSSSVNSFQICPQNTKRVMSPKKKLQVGLLSNWWSQSKSNGNLSFGMKSPHNSTIIGMQMQPEFIAMFVTTATKTLKTDFSCIMINIQNRKGTLTLSQLSRKWYAFFC